MLHAVAPAKKAVLVLPESQNPEPPRTSRNLQNLLRSPEPAPAAGLRTKGYIKEADALEANYQAEA